jgi:holo-[acyl-carrier protein] synthase
MKPQCIGIDLVEVSRIQEAINRWGDRFLNRIYTEAEQEAYKNKINSLAARFAAKEAVIKALNSEGQVSWREIEILAESSGKPVVILYGSTERKSRELGLTGFEVSLSHTRENAIAIVIGVQEV